MRILFRVDSGFHIGFGHVMRCMTLARFLKHSQKASIHFLCKSHEGSINQKVASEFPLTEFAPIRALDTVDPNNYSTWLRGRCDEDVDQIRQLETSQGKFDFVIVDHYALDAPFERELESRVMVIDDIAERDHHCSLLLNQNLGVSSQLYEGRNANQECAYLLGPQFALIRHEIARSRPTSAGQMQTIQSLGAFFGGSDLTNESQKVLAAFRSVHDSSLRLHLVLPESHTTYSEVRSLAAKDDRVKLSPFVDDMGAFYQESDLFLGSCGVSSWERACLGIPSFCVVSADNQRINAEAQAAEGVVHLLGDGTQTTQTDWESAFARLNDLPWLNSMAARGYAHCDGRGLERVVEKLL